MSERKCYCHWVGDLCPSKKDYTNCSIRPAVDGAYAQQKLAGLMGRPNQVVVVDLANMGLAELNCAYDLRLGRA